MRCKIPHCRCLIALIARVHVILAITHVLLHALVVILQPGELTAPALTLGILQAISSQSD